MSTPVPALAATADRCASALAEADRVRVAAHIDADGLTSAAVMALALDRREIPFAVSFHDQLDGATVDAIGRESDDFDTICFVDFGSGQLPAVTDMADDRGVTPVVVDHHQPAEGTLETHLNPLLAGIDGASALSGAGSAYLVARALAADSDGNRDLAALAVVGAVGDRQLRDGELVGANAAIVKEGVAAGVIEERTDLAMYGTQTRPLPRLLEYASDVRIPGITNDRRGAIRFLADLGVEANGDGDWPRWVDLSAENQRAVTNGLVRRGIEAGVPADRLEDLVGTAYILTAEEPGTNLRDASEFATVLNATARYDRAAVGLGVCLGDRDRALDAANRLLRNHRRQLSEGLSMVRTEGVTREEHVQWFHAEDRIPATVVGIVAGMAMGTDGIDGDRPILAFAEKDGNDSAPAVKVSARGTGQLVRAGLDLSAAMAEAAAAVDGEGGGHDVAAGATVPAGRESAFIAAVDRIVGRQLEP